MNWIRIATNIGEDERMEDLANVLRIRLAEAIGLTTLVLCKLPAKAKNGDLSRISASKLEEWSRWHGKSGAFNTAFRAIMCTEAGVVRTWDKHNGKAMEKAERDAERKRLWRALKDAEREAVQDAADDAARAKLEAVTRDGARRRRGLTASGNADGDRDRRADGAGNDTIRDELLLTTTTKTEPGGADAPPAKGSRSEPKFPHFPMALCLAMHRTWTEKRGGIPVSRFRRAFGPLFAYPPSERNPEAPSDDELQNALSWYLTAITSGRSAPFASPENAAQCLAAIALALRAEGVDPDRKLGLVESIVHGKHGSAA